MQARSALFDLYGDYLRPRGGRAPVAALVKLLAPLGIAPPAVRTAVSRMVRQGWLHPLRLVSGPGYLLTPKAARRLDEAAARIYRTGRDGWDGRFDLILLHGPGCRGRDGSSRLAFLGYGMLERARPGSRRAPADEVDARAGRGRRRVRAVQRQRTRPAPPGAAGVVGRAWDLAEIGRAYEDFVADQRPVVTAVNARSTDEEAYAARFRLVHAWRSFLFRDPQLPAAAAARALARHRARPASSTGTPPGCARPPTGTSNGASTSVSRSGRT